jgi:hypothetical protein
MAISKDVIAASSDDGGPIMRNVFVSSAWGIFFGCVMFGPIYMLSCHLTGAPPPRSNLTMLMMSWGVLAFPMMYVVASPSFLTAIFLAKIFRKSIEKHLVIWCCIAPFVIWLEVFSILTWFKSTGRRGGDFFEIFGDSLLDVQSLLPLLSAAVSSVIFYTKSIREKNSEKLKP